MLKKLAILSGAVLTYSILNEYFNQGEVVNFVCNDKSKELILNKLKKDEDEVKYAAPSSTSVILFPETILQLLAIKVLCLTIETFSSEFVFS